MVRTAFLLLLFPLSALAGGPGARPLSRSDAALDLIPATLPATGSVAVDAGEPVEDRKSPGMAAVYSLLLPGMGELYAGGFSTGKYFLIAEGVLWLGYATFDIYGNALRDDARAFAVAHAGVNPSGKDDQFYVNVGNFLNTDDYNQKRLRDNDFNLLYNPAAGYAWQWDSDASRLTFRDQRISSENAYNDRKFVIAAVIANHVASAINAARTAISHNASLAAVFRDVSVDARLQGTVVNPQGVMITLRKGF